MGYKSAFKEVMRDYDRDRTQAKNLLQKRQEEVYQHAPRIREIDEEIKNAGFAMAKAVLSGEGDGGELAMSVMKKNALLSEEKKAIMAENGFPEDYFSKIYKCMKCKDSGYVQLNTQGESTWRVEKCSCMKQKLIDRYYDLSNLRGILQNENFDTFDVRYYSEEHNPALGLSPRENIQVIYRVCNDFINKFDLEFGNLLFYGDTGLGKTFLCNCIAKDILDMGKTVLYVTAPQIFKTLEDYRFNRDDMEEPDEMIDALTEVDLLIIDDLGTEFSTVVTSSGLFNIINTRLLEKKHTVISTNLSPVDFESQYSERIVSRFIGHYKMLKFLGEDIRRVKKYGRLEKLGV